MKALKKLSAATLALALPLAGFAQTAEPAKEGAMPPGHPPIAKEEVKAKPAKKGKKEVSGC